MCCNLTQGEKFTQGFIITSEERYGTHTTVISRHTGSTTIAQDTRIDWNDVADLEK